MAIALVEDALRIAAGEIGVREEPPGSNRSERIDEYIRAAGLDPEDPFRRGKKRGYPYCAALLVWAFARAARKHGIASPCPRTAKVARLWERAPAWARTKTPSRGAIFIHLLEPNDPESDGHAGIVEHVILGTPGFLLTIEGNTGPQGAVGQDDRDGDGVRAKRRELKYVNVGYLDFSRAPAASLDG